MTQSAVKERPILMSAVMVKALLAGTKTQTRRVAQFPSWVTEINQIGLWFEGVGSHPKGECDHVRCSHIGAIAGNGGPSSYSLQCPYGKPGDRLWVRETVDGVMGCDATYVADEQRLVDAHPEKWNVWRDGRALACKTIPSIFVPRWASRLLLEVTEVRMERLQEISEEDAEAEGIVTENVVVGANCNGGIHTEEYGRRSFADGVKGASDEGYESSIDAYRVLWESINGKKHPWAANPWVWAVTFRMLDAEESK